MTTFPIPYGRQNIDDQDIEAVVQAMEAEFLTQGPMVGRFEDAMTAYCGAKHAVAVNSATSALHIACLSLGVTQGDLVWTTPITFVATSNCALYCGASVDFVDIDPATYNMSVSCLEEKLAMARRIGRLPKVVIPVHMAGQSCDMQAIWRLGQEYGFSIIEDASHAVGARYQGEPVGYGRYSDVTVFSFHPVKIITSGEGGMALTNDPALASQMRKLRSHGITSVPSDMEPRPENELWNYQQVGLGFNYRLTDILAALGLSQMRRLDEFVASRHAFARRYDEIFAGLPLTTPAQSSQTYSSYHLYVIRLHLNEIDLPQREVFRELHHRKILVNLHYIPVYLQPYYQKLGFKPGLCPEAERYFKEAMSIPLYPHLGYELQDRVIDALTEVLNHKLP
jgi:UDP-4-amino-4,6-dideoxy-N-acetyl-beta-L-altrosamine transaminase